MFVVGVLYCVQLLSEVKMFQNHSLLYFSFPLLILLLFTFLAPFFWNSQKCPISQKNIGRLTKTQLKNSTQTIFQGGSPSASLVLNSMFSVGVRYCVQLLFGVKMFKHSFYHFFCQSLFLLLSFILLGIKTSRFFQRMNFSQPKKSMNDHGPQ